MKHAVKFVLATVMTTSLSSVVFAHDNGYAHRHQNNTDDQLIGGLIGAVAGGVLGSQVAGNGARTEGSAIGAVVGGLTGAAIAGSGGNRSYYGGNYNTGSYNQGYAQPYYSGGTSYYNSGYSQPYYGNTYYSGTTYYRPAPVYYSGYNQPRVSINFNTGFNTGRYYRSSRPYYRPVYSGGARPYNGDRRRDRRRRR